MLSLPAYRCQLLFSYIKPQIPVVSHHTGLLAFKSLILQNQLSPAPSKFLSRGSLHKVKEFSP